MTTYKWLSHWKTCTSGSVVKSWPMMSKVSGSNPAATKVFFRGLNDVYVCHVTWNTKMTTSDRKKKFSTWNHIENACRKLTESWDGSSLIRSSSRRPWNFPDGQMVPGRYPDAVCYQGYPLSLQLREYGQRSRVTLMVTETFQKMIMSTISLQILKK